MAISASVLKTKVIMCTRFYIDTNNPTLEEIMKAAEGRSALKDRIINKYAKPLKTSGEIRPTDIVPVIAPSRSGRKAVFPMKWGFTISGKRSPIVNARTETAASKPTFAESWVRRRCIVPASWYYEWEHFKSADGKTKTGDKYLIQPAGSSVTWLCGLYRFEDEIPVFTILTRAPGGELAAIHDRMPLIMPDELVDHWISNAEKPEDLLQYALTDMMIEKADNQHLTKAGDEAPLLSW